LEQSEVETLIEELETRVDRLRALYEQYFIGIERLEPSVPRKDVERRFYVLRRTQIRNTALRFRFQNVLLRYNTYQTYWIRICRQIEEGTYKRDVRRANARFASSVAPPRTEELAADDMEEVHDTAPPSTFELELDFDADDHLSSPPGIAPGLAVPATLPDVPLTKLRPAQPEPQPRPLNLPKSRLLEVPATPTERQAPFGLPIVGVFRDDSPPGPPRKPTEAPVPKRAVAPPLPPPPPRAQHPRTVAPPVPVRPPSSRPGADPLADAPTGVRRKSRQSMPRVEAQKVPVAAAVQRPLKPAPGPSPPAEARAASDLSDERVRQIYKQYVETKRSHQESTASLTFDSLARSLRESSDKLKKKHAGKTVDFEVAIKDGKTILRPVVK
jgi:hypothetical protein